MAGENQTCIYRQIVHDPSSTTRLLHTDEKFVEFQDIKPAARRHYLVIPKEHIPTARDLQRRDEDCSLDLVFTSRLLTVSIISISIVLHCLLCPDGNSSSTSLWDLLVVLLKQRHFWRR
ncbi:bifunctional adenosine 5'-phosphosulfate phosphorylase/adenylylsulfatase HINT4-like isoform X1 [Raphanus sativus]|uniref:Bifunctional adenosine 5'-phosphosulfate phosphorylase/adenylylsulfatase HINT4-like isoform X1 n=1 Tax=Raphanus sativus TaxID=3726 RepID=A0A9W3CIM7_RAPSA|nr:bifunctional adenosine 5'-phosphosulfate phosphorylase/adenylylsulfatase HINT4-like isoform X1 [Raphanus sativus]